MTDITVRRACVGDVRDISMVLIASITELCTADHHNDPRTVAGWTQNKSPDGVTAMLNNPDVQFLVANRAERIVGVGAINHRVGHISLNYVVPEARFAGVSTRLLLELEAALVVAGFKDGQLESTATALRFYRSRGWTDMERQTSIMGLTGHQMVKRLAP